VQLIEQLDPLGARRRIAAVIEIDDYEVELARADATDDRGGRMRGDDFITLRLEQQPQGLDDVGLIVADQDRG